MGDPLLELIMRTLRETPAEIVGAALVLVSVLVLWAIFHFLIRRIGSQGGVNIRLDIPMRLDIGRRFTRGPSIEGISDVARANESLGVNARQTEDLRRRLSMVYRGMMLLGAIGLLLGAILAYFAATPGNGLLLVALLLFALSIIALLSTLVYRREERDRELDRSPIDELLENVKVSTSFAGLEVHTLDSSAIARARAMSQQGMSLDEICRTIDVKYGAWDPSHQQAFRNVIQAVLKTQ
jgi:hypothetical protein